MHRKEKSNVMGIYLNPGNVMLQQEMNSRIYVDKSMLIAELNLLVNSAEKFVCVSRARRFGKSMAGNMIAAYYSKDCNSRELFDKLKLSKDPSYERYLNKLNVIKFDLNGFYNTTRNRENLIGEIERRIVAEFAKRYTDLSFDREGSLSDAMLEVFSSTGEQFVVIIDEYDVLVRERVSQRLFDDYLRFLNGLFKNADLAPTIALAYLTGILPIVRDKIQSKLNVFAEYTMADSAQLSEFVGFTSNEVKELCRQHDMDFEECRRWYDGYDLGSVKEVFNPKSVVMAMTRHAFGSYWTQTGSYEALKDYILMNFEGIKDDVITMIGGGKVDVAIWKYLNTMTDFHSKDDVFAYLIHLGYLAYDEETQQCYIPNNEIRDQWVVSIETSPDYKEIIRMVNNSKRLVEAAIGKDEQAVAEALEEAHSHVTSPLTYNNEASFQSAIGLAFFYATAKYTIIKELPTGKGYADLALIPYVPNTPAMIIELKNNKSAESALQQILDKKYDDILRNYRGNLLFVGVSYDPSTKKHECKIQEYEV